MVVRMHLCIFHFFSIDNIELDMLATMRQKDFDHAGKFFQVFFCLHGRRMELHVHECSLIWILIYAHCTL